MRTIVSLFCLALATAGIGSTVPAAAEEEEMPAMTDAEIRHRADALIARMTPREKAGQLAQYFWIVRTAATVQGVKFAPFDYDTAIASGEVGSLLLVNDVADANRLQHIAVEKSRLGIPLLFGFDVIHGLKTILPVPIGMAASWDPDMVERSQAMAATEARAAGINWTFAPMVDIGRDPRWGRVIEGAGEDPVLGSAMAAAQVRGFQGPRIGTPGRVLAGPKHFAGYGAAIGGRDYDEVDLSENQLRNVYLPPFKAAIDAGAGNIMSAYMSLNGVPAAVNGWLLNDVLRKEWNFSGFVVTDANGVDSLQKQGAALDASDAAALALRAGTDMAMTFPKDASPMLALPDALAEGKIKGAQLDDAVRRILELKIRMNLFEQPYVDERASVRVLSDPAHREVTRIAAERSAVLLANPDGLLPLDHGKLKTLALIGPLADSAQDTLGPWVFPSSKPRGVSVLEGLKAKLGTNVEVRYSEGVRIPERVNRSFFDSINPPAARPSIDEVVEFKRAVELARTSDVAVLVLGESQNMAGEAASRSSLELPGRQLDLLKAVIATGKPVVVVLINGRPLDLADAKPGAVLEAWYPGSEGGTAVANLLFGDAVPGGKLPFSWIWSAGQAPYTYAHLPSHAPDSAQKRYWDIDGRPVWPFGFGLSYTTFAYGNPKVEQDTVAVGQPVRISFDLTNTGARAGDEVAQLYLHQRVGSSSRPVRELKKFARVSLAPGETRLMTFTLTDKDLQYWSGAKRAWVQEPSGFDVWIGSDSQAELATQFTVRDAAQ